MQRTLVRLVVLLALGVLVVPLATEAQRLVPMPRMGYLADNAHRTESEALRQALGELGYVEGQPRLRVSLCREA